jgi:hypothetical protein
MLEYIHHIPLNIQFLYVTLDMQTLQLFICLNNDVNIFLSNLKLIKLRKYMCKTLCITMSSFYMHFKHVTNIPHICIYSMYTALRMYGEMHVIITKASNHGRTPCSKLHVVCVVTVCRVGDALTHMKSPCNADISLEACSIHVLKAKCLLNKVTSVLL